MGFSNFLQKIFGTKAQRDMREIQPMVDKIKAAYVEVDKLSNDALRAKTQELKARVAKSAEAEQTKIAEIRTKIEATDIDSREPLYKEIDKLESQIKENLEEALTQVLPEAFAVMKSTARRFAENAEIRVTATDFDRSLAVKHDFVSIDGNEAVYKNEWEAGGNILKWDMVHYDVQLFGGVVLHQGKIAEMATGEGKTLVATLPVFLNALTGRGVHVVTVNDYLSKRDSEWMGPLYMFHGLSVDCIDKHQPNSDDRRKAYNADITFGTNNEFGFDYLRDNMAISPLDLVQREHNFAIVDEVDSVLIDDARTPLIISGPVPKGEDQLFDDYRPRVEQLVKAQNSLAVSLLAEARNKLSSLNQDRSGLSSDEKKELDKKIEEGSLALFRSYKAMPKSKALIKQLSEQGMKAEMTKTEEFYMQENNKNMHIATDPLYFVIDEKHNSIELTDKGIEALTKSSEDPDFFVLPDVGAEIAELEHLDLSEEERMAKKDEIYQNYAIKTERIHTITQLLKAYTLFFRDEQYVVIENKVKIVDEQTGRIMEGRRYSDGLHQAIEAKEHVKVEAATQTFATITLQNYFRMYNKLSGMTGTAETEAGELMNIYKLDVVVIPTNKPIARIDMDDRVYKTKREKYTAVIDEIMLMRNSGRPVLVGTTSVEISELLSNILKRRNIPHQVLNAKLHQREADIVALAGQCTKGMVPDGNGGMKEGWLGTVTIATNMAGRGTDIKLSPEVKAAGGLAIIGTERHESRRVDRQLRGRSGRQGDPGSSVFFVSLEDNLMRLFGAERISKVMDRMGFEEGERIEHKMINSSIERAQKKVEENNFGIRKRLLEYDDVMNTQRNVVYARRRHALMGERIGVDVVNTLYDCMEAVVVYCRESADYETFQQQVTKTFAIEAPVDRARFNTATVSDLVNDCADAVFMTFKRKMDKLCELTMPVLKRIYEERGEMIKNIIVPITDGKRGYNVLVNLEAAVQSEGKALVLAFEKSIMLHTIDEAWKEHLRALDDLKTSVQNASYEQKDPLVIYKIESYDLFKKMLHGVNEKVASILMRGQVKISSETPESKRNVEERRSDYSKYNTKKDDMTPTQGGAPGQAEAQAQDTRAQQKTAPIRAEKTVGRNDPCPCGSGKKYKNCCGANL
ncbi:MAG: preprotein translocase subunit SecA [Paludibacteraceae bacterium]|nr:preprotein translocase subunit SecA [Paludibacteraceae bacterium]